mmetsp:Transcript_78826/g.210530  ORF Transcript_78826/g.210530 Transcript_78826/m.210530 type:complete len:237 (+) Transcript_78826:46-756(+)
MGLTQCRPCQPIAENMMTAMAQHRAGLEDCTSCETGDTDGLGGTVEELRLDSRGQVEETLPTSLVVPDTFWKAVDDKFTKDQQKTYLASSVKEFVGAMQHGLQLQVLLDDGTSLPATASIDKRLTSLMLSVRNWNVVGASGEGFVGDVSRSVPFSAVDGVSSGHNNIVAMADDFIDERCATLLLGDGGQFLTFRLSNGEDAEYFATCLRVLVAADKERARVEEGRIIAPGGPGVAL